MNGEKLSVDPEMDRHSYEKYFRPCIRQEITPDEFIRSISERYDDASAQGIFELSLFMSVCRGWLFLADALHEQGIRIPSESDSDDVVLQVLWRSGDRPRLDALEWLLDHGYSLYADEMKWSPSHMNGYFPLHVCAAKGHLELAKLLVSRGAEINLRTSIDGRLTPLMLAAENGHRAVVEWLLELGADQAVRCQETDKTAKEMADQNVVDLF